MHVNELQPELTIHGERFNKDSSFTGSCVADLAPSTAVLTMVSHHSFIAYDVFDTYIIAYYLTTCGY